MAESIHRNAPIDDIASYIIIEPPPLCCGSSEFDPTLPDELRRYGVDDLKFQVVVQAIQRQLAGAKIKFWAFTILCVMITTAGVATIATFAVKYGNIFIYVYGVTYGIPLSILFIASGCMVGCWCRLSTFNGLEDVLEQYDTEDYTWAVRSAPVSCGQMELKRCVVQCVPRPSAILKRAEAGEADPLSGQEDEDGEVIVATTDEEACVVCFDRRISTRVEPCGHKILCGRCSKKVQQCPMCRTPIAQVVKEPFNKSTDATTPSTTPLLVSIN